MYFQFVQLEDSSHERGLTSAETGRIPAREGITLLSNTMWGRVGDHNGHPHRVVAPWGVNRGGKCIQLRLWSIAASSSGELCKLVLEGIQ